MSTTGPLNRADVQSRHVSDAKLDAEKHPHSFKSGLMFVAGAAAIAIGLIGAVASCALFPIAPAAAMPVIITLAAAIAAGFTLIKASNKERLANQEPQAQDHRTIHNNS